VLSRHSVAKSRGCQNRGCGLEGCVVHIPQDSGRQTAGAAEEPRATQDVRHFSLSTSVGPPLGEAGEGSADSYPGQNETKTETSGVSIETSCLVCGGG
jgi:hypothetical protein